MTRFEKIRAVFWVAAIALVAVMLFLGIRPAQADETWFAATIASRHARRDQGYNEHNLGLGGERQVASNLRLIAGFYENSFYRTSVYAGANYMPLHLGNFSVGLMGGLVTGYRDGARPAPIALPLVQYEQGRFGANLVVAPKVELNKPAVVGLQLKWRFL